MLTRPLLIGRGPWAQKVYTALPHGVQATVSGSQTCRDDIREAKARGNDAVIIASITHSHYDLILRALEQKLPIFCEKPMVLTVQQAEHIQLMWEKAEQPPFLCNFVHLWSLGFDYAWPRFRSQGGLVSLGGVGNHIPTPKFLATFAGSVRRKDVHPVWDYGCHAIAMALMLGIDLRGLTMSSDGDQWTLENEHFELLVDAGSQEKKALVHLDKVFNYDGATWKVYPSDRLYLNADAPPLQRALKWFLNTNKDAWRSASPNRDGLWLPVQVTRVLESVCPPESPFK